MCSLIIWVDREQAKVFRVEHTEIEKIQVHADSSQKHLHANDQIYHKNIERKFFKEIISKLRIDVKRVLILGPGVSKHHFLTYLQEHSPKLGRMVLACETVDHPSDNEILHLAEKHFTLPKVIP